MSERKVPGTLFIMKVEETDRASETIPTISAVLGDATLVELLYDKATEATALAVSRPDGSIVIADAWEDTSAGHLVPYTPRNNLISTGCVVLPSDVGEVGDEGDLVEAVRGFLHRYVDLTPAFEELAAHYVLLTWVYDAFDDLPYLRLRGDPGTGKTRALLALGSLCYKAFFASGASTVSPLFHILDAFQGTLILDEADFRFSDATAELTKILNNGTTRGLPVLRTMTNRNKELHPTAFRVFGPKIIAMREGFADQALESRVFTEATGGRSLRGDIPIHLPPEFRREGLELRNRLLGWRFAARRRVASNPARLIPGLPPRKNQMALALLSIVEDEDVRERIAVLLRADTSRAAESDPARLDAVILESVREARGAAPGGAIGVAAITEAFNRRSAARLGPMTNRWVGAYLKSRFGVSTMKTRGVYVLQPTDGARLLEVAERSQKE